MKLFARPCDDLQWKIEEGSSVFEFVLGLDEPYFPLEDELRFHSLSAALTHFTQTVWPQFSHAQLVLYRGRADFASCFQWSERQEANFAAWKEGVAVMEEGHLRRLFCAEAFVHYFQMLSHRLPDEAIIRLVLETQGLGSQAHKLHLLSPKRFEHFSFSVPEWHCDARVGVCFPDDARCSEGVLDKIDTLLNTLPSFRPVYESLLTEQWDGLDEIYVVKGSLSEQGERKLKGFTAAGGMILE